MVLWGIWLVLGVGKLSIMYYMGTSTKAMLSGNHGEDVKKPFSDGNESDTQNAVIEPMTNTVVNSDRKIRISSKK